MSDTFELKSISLGAVTKAAERAEHYRLLNDPAQAESICLDVLEVDPDNQQVLVTLVLSITDQFAAGGVTASPQRARSYLARLHDDYQKTYYAGLIHERQAQAFLGRGMARMFAYDGFRHAMDLYETAEANRPEGNDDPVLRWNSCARTIMREQLQPREDDAELPLE
jgi:hypothetical protein